MSKMRFDLNKAGVRDLLRSAEMESVVSSLASDISGRCGEGYATDSHVGKNRVNAMVYADTDEAKKDNLGNNTILKAVR